MRWRVGLCVAALSLLVPSSALASVSAFPSPGSRLATAHTQISLRGVSSSAIGMVVVTGSSSGLHPGMLVPDSDGHGASFYPKTPFTAGEVVTVRTTLPVVGGHSGDFQFTIERPAGRIGPPSGRLPGPRVRNDVDAFHSRPDLQPPAVNIDRSYAGAKDVFVTAMRGPLQWGPMIVDRWGHLVWFQPVSGATTEAANFTVQRYLHRPVLTWWQGYVNQSSGQGLDVILNQSYKTVAVVRAGNGLSADLHEFLITPRQTALITAYSLVHWNGSSVHRAKQITVLNCTVQEIDIRTGNVLFQWDSLDHVPLRDSYQKPPGVAFFPYDYFHVNSVRPASDGSLIVSARNTWAVYKIDRSTGAVRWVLGGKHSSFKMGRGTETAFQHDAESHSGGLMTIFDDGAFPRVHPQSRVILERIDERRHTASLVREFDHSPRLVSRYEGNAQLLGNGHVFAGWGQQPYFTEFDRRGKQIYDGRFVGARTSYRAYEFSWHGQPATAPAAAVRRGADGISTVYASWNGATDVGFWKVLAGSSPNDMRSVAVVRPHGFETAINVASEQPYFTVEPLSSKRGRLATSSLTGSTRSRVSIFGHSSFISGGGTGGLQVGCFASATCRLGGSVSVGATKVATVSKQSIAANTGGLLFFHLTARGRKMLARSGSRGVAATAGVRNSDGGSGFTHLTLVAYRTSGPSPSHATRQGRSLRILAHTAFVSPGGVAGVFTQCAGASACHARVTVRVGGRVIATGDSQLIAAQDCGILFFNLTARGGQLLDRARGNDLGALLTARAGGDKATAHVSLVRFH